MAFYAVTSIAVLGLYLSFAVPIWLRWRHGEKFEVGPWNNGAKYKWMNPIAVAEILIVSLDLMLPFVLGNRRSTTTSRGSSSTTRRSSCWARCCC